MPFSFETQSSKEFLTEKPFNRVKYVTFDTEKSSVFFQIPSVFKENMESNFKGINFALKRILSQCYPYREPYNPVWWIIGVLSERRHSRVTGNINWRSFRPSTVITCNAIRPIWYKILSIYFFFHRKVRSTGAWRRCKRSRAAKTYDKGRLNQA